MSGVALALVLLLADVSLKAGDTATATVVPSPRVVVPAGSFRMGATGDDLHAARRLCADEMRGSGALLLELSPRCGSRFDNESPQADVYLPAYAIDRTEVTVAAYNACVGAGACRAAPELRLDDGASKLPVEGVTWAEASAFCRWRGGRLPSEAEWEKAARGTGRRVWPWGVDWQERRANHGRSQRIGGGGEEETFDGGDGFPGPAPVGAFAGGASPFGVLDVAGNVWEWTSGYFSREPPQATTRFDPRGPLGGDERTIRGGSYRSPPSDLRLTRRMGLAPGERSPAVGFRCAYDTTEPSRATARGRVGAQLYVWIQHYGEKGTTLEAHLEEALAATRRAGFDAVQGWLSFHATVESAARTNALLTKHGLVQRAAYAGGPMHEPRAAAKTIADIVERARRAKTAGLEIVVMNPDPLDREKTDAELTVQARQLDTLGARLRALGVRLAVHAHDKEMRSGAREWFHILRHTRAENVGICLDLHWAVRGGQDPFALLEAAGQRVLDLHLRNATGGVWTEELGPGDIDYERVARALAAMGYAGLYTVELAYEPKTPRTRPLQESLARSRAFVRRVLGF